jgi:hypothetical protein
MCNYLFLVVRRSAESNAGPLISGSIVTALRSTKIIHARAGSIETSRCCLTIYALKLPAIADVVERPDCGLGTVPSFCFSKQALDVNFDSALRKPSA